MIDLFDLSGKAALVTGTSRGLGQGMAVALAQAGADVATLDRSPAEATVQAIQACGRRALPLTCDLAQATPDRLREVVDEAVAAFGHLDILVNNAGIIRRSPAVDIVPADWDDVLRVDLDAAFWLAQAAGRRFVAQGSGKVVTVASALTFQGGANVVAYAAAKHAVAGMTKALANEWAGSGVNVNAIAPGYMATDNTAPLRADPARRSSISERIPAGRWGVPEDLAGAVVFLASAASDYVHGSVLVVDGGWLGR